MRNIGEKLVLFGQKIGMISLQIDSKIFPASVVEVLNQIVLFRCPKTHESNMTQCLVYIDTHEKLKKPQCEIVKKFAELEVTHGRVEYVWIPDLVLLSSFEGKRENCIELSTLNSISKIDKKEVDIRGISIGHGTQGVMKLHNFKGNKKTHGCTKTHRRPGTIAGGTLWKGKSMPGRMGVDQICVQNLTVLKLDEKLNLLYVCGAIPGHKNNIIEACFSFTKENIGRYRFHGSVELIPLR